MTCRGAVVCDGRLSPALGGTELQLALLSGVRPQGRELPLSARRGVGRRLRHYKDTAVRAGGPGCRVPAGALVRAGATSPWPVPAPPSATCCSACVLTGFRGCGGYYANATAPNHADVRCEALSPGMPVWRVWAEVIYTVFVTRLIQLLIDRRAPCRPRCQPHYASALSLMFLSDQRKQLHYHCIEIL